MPSRPLAAVGSKRPTIVSLFSGIGGLDIGFDQAGFEIGQLCEIWEPARRVLQAHWPGTPILTDVRAIDNLPTNAAGLLAGFPCTNLSLAGDREGIDGTASRLVHEALRLAHCAQLEWVLFENVGAILGYGGRPMSLITTEVEAAGYQWAYRVVDARFTGLPQRRPRLLLLAARTFDPAQALLADDAGPPSTDPAVPNAYGFYWTEGRRGLGWTTDAIPPLKGGSTIGLPSAPGVWLPGASEGRRIVIPSIAQGERLQGFEAGWTSAAHGGVGPDHRWKLVGNAVPPSVAHWIARRILEPGLFEPGGHKTFRTDRTWPHAAWGGAGERFVADVSAFPRHDHTQHLADVVDPDFAQPLSSRATAGFLRRLDQSNLKPPPAFVADLRLHAIQARENQPDELPRAARYGRRHPHGGVLPPNSNASNPAARSRMLAAKPSNTAPELALRKELWARGHRYRLQARVVPGTTRRVDLVLPSARLAIDVRGCFWHACPQHGTFSSNNAAYWSEKLRRNVQRDIDTERRLRSAGWTVVIVWEHESVHDAADRIEESIATIRAAHKDNQAS